MEGDFFAGMPVRDRDVAMPWYDALLGAPPAFFPNDREAVWQLGDGRFLYVEVRGDHAGHGMHTVFVPDLAVCLADIAARGLRPAETETYDNGVSKAIFRDPDGNEFGVAGATTASSRPDDN